MRSVSCAYYDEATVGRVYDINSMSRRAASPRARAVLLSRGAPEATRAVSGIGKGVLAGFALWLLIAAAILPLL